MAPVASRIVMLGAAPQTPGSVAAVVDAYRAHGLFRRWPIEYLATHGGDGALRDAKAMLAALRRFARILALERGTVVHLHVESARGFWRDAPFMALAIAARCPLILHLHRGDLQQSYDRAGPLARAAMRYLLEHAANVVVPFQALGQSIRGITRRAQVACVPYPVAPREPPQDGGRPELVLFLGTLEPEQGIFDLLQALSAVRAAVPDLRLVCAGDGDRAAVVRYAESLGIADVVKFTGWVGPSAKRALFENAAALALPSYGEASSMVLLEAMAAGVPAVVSPVGGVPEIVADGVSGFVAAPGDVASLQRLLRKLLLDRGLRARLGAAARESVRLRCAPERALASLGEIYSRLEVGGAPEIGSGTHPVGLDR